MKLAEVAVMVDGRIEWDGTLTSFIRANNSFPTEFPPIDWRALCRDLRAGLPENTPHGRPEPATLGGGAAPIVYVSLIEPCA